MKTEDFLQKLQTQVKKCSYGANANEFVMDQIVVGVYSDTTRQKLWTKDDLTLDKTKKICRAAERAAKEMNELQATGLDQNVNAIKNTVTFNCKRCGSKHGPRQCPAYGKECKNCSKNGRFAKMCKSKNQSSKGSNENRDDKKPKNKKSKNQKKGERKVNAISDDLSDSEECEISAITDSAGVNAVSENEKWCETLKIGRKFVTVKLDTGAECSVLPKREATRLALDIEKSNPKRIVTYIRCTNE